MRFGLILATLFPLLVSAAPTTTASNGSALRTAAPPEVKPEDLQPKHVSLPPPSSDQQIKILDAARNYATDYVHKLPDFVCLEQIRRYRDPSGNNAWQLEDVVTAQLSYFDQKEEYKLVSQNGRAVANQPYAAVSGAYSMGDFGTTMNAIFDSATHAGFVWKRAVILNGRPMHVFSFRVPVEFSKFIIEYRGDEEKHDLQRVKVAYRGSVFVDQELNTVVRIVREAVSIEPAFPVKQAEQTLDYDFTQLGDRKFFLPRVASLQMRSRGGMLTKNVKEFGSYQKFSADAVLKFDDQEPTPQTGANNKALPPK